MKNKVTSYVSLEVDDEELPFAEVVETSFVSFPDESESLPKRGFRLELTDKINNIQSNISDWIIRYNLDRIFNFESRNLNEEAGNIALKNYEEALIIVKRLSKQENPNKHQQKRYTEFMTRMQKRADNNYEKSIQSNYDIGCLDIFSESILEVAREYNLQKTIERYEELTKQATFKERTSLR